MSYSEEITRAEPDSAAAEYGGYSPRHQNDFPLRENSHSFQVDESAPTLFLDPSLSKHKPIDRMFSLATIVVCGLLFIILLIGGTAAPCAFGLCGKIDRSSEFQQTSYDIEVYDFEAPFKFAWGAFAVFILSCAIFSLYSFVLSKKETGDENMKLVAAYIRKASFSLLLKQLVLLAPVILALFILVGVGYSMRAAGCLFFGALTAVLLSLTTIMVATTGNVRAAAAAAQSRSQAMTIELRTATIITVASYSFAIGGPSFSYLIFRDVRALSGFIIGALTVTLIMRISGGIFHKASNINRDPTSHGPSVFGIGRNNPTIIADNAGLICGRAVGQALQTFAAFTISVITTSILATSFPYFGDNNYALCVFDHIEVDNACTGFLEPRKKLSFAATICRANGFFQNYPLLSVWASNSAFVAVPFILGFTGVLVTLVCTAYRSTPGNADAAVGDEDIEKTMKPFLTRIRLSVGAAALLTIICAASVTFGLFGNNSAFYEENTTEREVFTVAELTSENADTRCRPPEASSDSRLSDLPPLEVSRRAYETRDSFGEMFPGASQTGWRLGLCVLLGVILGMGLGLTQEVVVSTSRSAASLVAENGEFGASAVLVEGLGVSFLAALGSFAVVLILVLGCYELYGAYGIGVSAIGLLSIAGPLCMMSLFDVISESAKGINGVFKGVDERRWKTDGFESVGKRMWSVWKSVVNTGLMLGVICSLFVVIQEANVTPSTRQVGGSVIAGPTRHVIDIDETSLAGIYTLVSTIIGVMGGFVFCGSVFLGMSRVWHEVRVLGKSKAESQRDYERCTQMAGTGSTVETVLPVVVAMISPLVIGFGFGQGALLGMVSGWIGMCLILGQAFCVGGGIWESGSRVVANGRFGKEHSVGKWSDAMSGGEGVGFILGEYVGPCVMMGGGVVGGMSAVVIGMMRVDESMWWIGGVVGGVFGGAGVGLIVGLNRRYDDMVGEDEAQGVVGVDRRGMSPFYEGGPRLLREHINRVSQLGDLTLDNHQPSPLFFI